MDLSLEDLLHRPDEAIHVRMEIQSGVNLGSVEEGEIFQAFRKFARARHGRAADQHRVAERSRSRFGRDQWGRAFVRARLRLGRSNSVR